MHAATAYARSVDAATTAPALVAAAGIVAPRSPDADAVLGGLAPPVLAIHPGAGSRAKRWDIAGFVQVAHWWRAGGGSVLAVVGPAEAGEPPALGGTEIRDWPLVDLAAVLSRAALYVGNDSGVTHLAAAVGARGAALYGPTDPGRWRPISSAFVTLRARATGPDGIPLVALPASRVIAACRRRFALTRGDPEISVPPYRLRGRS